MGLGLGLGLGLGGLLEQRHVSGPAALHDGGHVGGGELQLVRNGERGTDRHLAVPVGAVQGDLLHGVVRVRVRVRVRVGVRVRVRARVRVRVRVRVSWSLEKRATMRPSGVVSKKLIGACMTAASMALCSAEAARSSANAKVQSRPTETSSEARTHRR